MCCVSSSISSSHEDPGLEPRLLEKFGYRQKVCLLCERDETLRYLVAKKCGISVNATWIHSVKGGAFFYANDVDLLFDDQPEY